MRDRLFLLIGSLVLWLQVVAQTRVVTGTINDNNGQPLPGVTVRIAGTQTATVTDTAGTFSITVPPAARNLEISYVGYATQTVSIPADGTISVRLQQATSGTLQEVVVTGYGTRRRTEFTGATSKVTSADIQQVPIASFDQILQGRAPGLYVASGSGQPGASARVNIRGVGTLGGGTDPLYVVDGIPVEPGVFRTLNPNDFESVDVLKDASGASLYGSRGANGVIVITTRRGRSGKPVIQYRGQAGVSNPPENNIEMMNTAQRLQFEEQILGPSGILARNAAGLTGFPGWDYSPNNPRFAGLTAAQKQTEAARLDSIRQINTDWQDIFFRNGTFSSHEINASGGTGTTNFFTSLSYFGQEGVVIRSSLDRYTFRGNVDFRTDRLSVSLRTGAGWSRQSGIESEAGVALANPIAAAFLTLPYERLYRPDGGINVAAGRIGPNAYDRLFTTTSLINQFKGTLGVTAQFDIWRGLAFRTTNGIDYRNNNSSRFVDPTSFAGTQVGAGAQGSYNEGNAEYTQMITTTGFTYGQDFAERHRLNAQAMFEYIVARDRSFNATGFGLNPKLPNTPAGITPGSGTNNFIPTVGGGRTRNAIASVFAVADYTLDRKYTLSASIRNDAPSQVPIENRNNIFWSVGASWNAMEETFMKSQNIFQDLRIRASHGSAANAAGFASNFGYLISYGAGSYAGTPGIVPTSPGNPELELEAQVISNIGIELATWQRRLRTTFELYNKESRNLFASQPLSRTTGFNALNVNAATVRNRGFEASVAADLLTGSNYNVTFGFNAAYLDNEITSLGALNEFVSGTSILRVGLPIGTHYTVGWVGVDPQTGNPLYQDSTGKTTTVYSASNNRATFGTYLPKWTGGANLDARWKGLDFGVLFSFAQDVQRFNNERFFYEGGNNLFQYNQRAEMLNAWQKSGDVTEYQRVGAGSSRQFSSKDINDASFIRLRNVNLGYTFNFGQSRPIRGFRVFVQGQNLATWTKWEGFDPEESNNIATYEFPNPRTYTVGLDINF